jgi:hypothetical protein
MFTLFQKHPQHSEFIYHPDSHTELEARSLIVKAAGLSGIDLSNLDNYKTVVNECLDIYRISGSNYSLSKPITTGYVGNSYEK